MRRYGTKSNKHQVTSLVLLSKKASRRTYFQIKVQISRLKQSMRAFQATVLMELNLTVLA